MTDSYQEGELGKEFDFKEYLYGNDLPMSAFPNSFEVPSVIPLGIVRFRQQLTTFDAARVAPPDNLRQDGEGLAEALNAWSVDGVQMEAHVELLND
jgi:hypothetical protein